MPYLYITILFFWIIYISYFIIGKGNIPLKHKFSILFIIAFYIAGYLKLGPLLLPLKEDPFIFYFITAFIEEFIKIIPLFLLIFIFNFQIKRPLIYYWYSILAFILLENSFYFLGYFISEGNWIALIDFSISRWYSILLHLFLGGIAVKLSEERDSLWIYNYHIFSIVICIHLFYNYIST